MKSENDQLGMSEHTSQGCWAAVFLGCLALGGCLSGTAGEGEPSFEATTAGHLDVGNGPGTNYHWGVGNGAPLADPAPEGDVETKGHWGVGNGAPQADDPAPEGDVETDPAPDEDDVEANGHWGVGNG